jgi:cobalt-zinc-cadmium efflux system protein
MGHDHSHSHGGVRASRRHVGKLRAALAVLVVFAALEVVFAFVSGSLALLSDAGHMVTDVLGIAMALAAIHLADRESDRKQRTFGLYRLEILAALANAVLLVGVGIYVVYEAVRRLSEPVEVLTGTMLVVALGGLAANVVAFFLLRQGAAESLNVKGAYLEVLSDLVGSVGVVLAALLIGATGWEWVDPLVGVAIGIFIVPRAVRLGREALRILVQAAPADIDLDELEQALESVPGVVDVHDLHVWTLTSEMEVATAHLMVTEGTDHHAVLDQARAMLSERFGVGHATLQVEPDTHQGCDEISW